MKAAFTPGTPASPSRCATSARPTCGPTTPARPWDCDRSPSPITPAAAARWPGSEISPPGGAL